jgi:D-alanine-D-alanine ligase
MSRSSAPPRAETQTVGLVFETFDSYVRAAGDPEDWAAEYEPMGTIEALEAALRSRGHTPVRLGSPHALLARLGSGRVPRLDAGLCIAEGFGSRNREAWGPGLLEMAGVACLGSDALTLSLTLDKAWTHRMLEGHGVRVAPWCLVDGPGAWTEAAMPADFPLFVKPRWEGTAKGIRPSSRVEDRAGLEREVARVVAEYGQPALVEAFVPGAEYTVAVTHHAPLRAHAVLQRALDAATGIGLHALEGPGREGSGSATPGDAGGPGEAVQGNAEPGREGRQAGGQGPDAHVLPGDLTPALEAELQRLSLEICTALEVRDFARLDFRLAADGAPVFLEINPLPTFAPDGTFAILAELEGRAFDDWLGDVLQAGLDRLAATPWPGRRRPHLE